MNTLLDFSDVDKYGPQERSQNLALGGEQLARDEVDQFDRVAIRARATKGDFEQDYIVDGEVEIEGALRCSRCVEPFPFANRSPFHLTYRARPVDSGSSEEELELAEQDLDVTYYTDRQVELADLAVEQIQLTLPMKPLCSDACRGLCPKCGNNLNQQPCSCSDLSVDPRWGALGQIREELNRKK